MTDVLIRGVPDDDLRRIDEKAQRLGISRNEYLRRQIAQDAARVLPSGQSSAEVFRRLAVTAADVLDPEVMEDAWS